LTTLRALFDVAYNIYIVFISHTQMYPQYIVLVIQSIVFDALFKSLTHELFDFLLTFCLCFLFIVFCCDLI